jgi:hypothetical protein
MKIIELKHVSLSEKLEQLKLMMKFSDPKSASKSDSSLDVSMALVTETDYKI